MASFEEISSTIKRASQGEITMFHAEKFAIGPMTTETKEAIGLAAHASTSHWHTLGETSLSDRSAAMQDCKSCERRKGSAACNECGWWGNYRRAQNTKELGASPNKPSDDAIAKS